MTGFHELLLPKVKESENFFKPFWKKEYENRSKQNHLVKVANFHSKANTFFRIESSIVLKHSNIY